MRLPIAGIILFLASPSVAQDADPKPNLERIIEPLSPEDFLKLTPNLQGMYVGGLIEGMSYAYYGDEMPQYPKFVACVRANTLGRTSQEVVAYLNTHPEFRESVSGALAKTLGARCKH